MSKATWANVGGTWKQIKNVWENVGGTWKQKVVPKGNISGTWKDFIGYYTPYLYYMVASTGITKIDINTNSVIYTKTFGITTYGNNIFSFVPVDDKKILIPSPYGSSAYGVIDDDNIDTSSDGYGYPSMDNLYVDKNGNIYGTNGATIYKYNSANVLVWSYTIDSSYGGTGQTLFNYSVDEITGNILLGCANPSSWSSQHLEKISSGGVLIWESRNGDGDAKVVFMYNDVIITLGNTSGSNSSFVYKVSSDGLTETYQALPIETGYTYVPQCTLYYNSATNNIEILSELNKAGACIVNKYSLNTNDMTITKLKQWILGKYSSYNYGVYQSSKVQEAFSIDQNYNIYCNLTYYNTSWTKDYYQPYRLNDDGTKTSFGNSIEEKIYEVKVNKI